jgi:methionine synthase II (cobalamin-independent)
MQITINIPDDIAPQLIQNIPDISRRTLEALIAQAYRDEILTLAEVGQILNLDRWQVEGFLHQAKAYLHYDEQDLDHDRATLHQLRLEQTPSP